MSSLKTIKTIVGIDPGSRITGYGILQVDRDRIVHIDHGVIDVHGDKKFSRRIKEIGLQLRQIFALHNPDIVVIEQIFLGKNADSAFKLGHARGIAMYEAELCGSEVVEYATRLVKKGITGLGQATKEQVAMNLSRLMRVPMQGKIDASDALAMAYHHAVQIEVLRKMQHLHM
jgi:crossover junction endodeoxyribonuclease RuvC